MSAYAQLEAICKKINTLDGANAMLSWDQAAMMPAGGNEARAEQMATLQLLTHELLTSPHTGELLEQVNSDDLNEWQRANYMHMQRLRKHAMAVPETLLHAFSLATSRSEMIWRTARKNNDFASFAPAFSEVVTLVREIAYAKASHFGCAPYDACIDSFDPGLTMAMIDPVFSKLAAFLPSFISQVVERQRTLPTPSMSLQMPQAQQHKMGLTLMRQLGFDFEHGRLDISTHPFCGGTPQDVRITTRYDEQDFTSALFGVIHETGHALYEQNLPQQWLNQPVGKAVGMAMHESQSLFMEMQVARSQPYAHYFAKLLRHELGQDIEANGLYRQLNKVERSYIRVDADEATYPIHIILRYQLEKAIISGDLKVGEIPGAWNEAMEKMLGLKPRNDTEGCLQDIHWPGGSFGYFPSYTLGAIMAAQFFATAKQQLPTLEKDIEEGNFAGLVSWLNTHIHNQGSRYSTPELLQQVTCSSLNVGHFTGYLQGKYLG
jgi:carboxypeptidase Taq